MGVKIGFEAETEPEIKISQTVKEAKDNL